MLPTTCARAQQGNGSQGRAATVILVRSETALHYRTANFARLGAEQGPHAAGVPWDLHRARQATSLPNAPHCLPRYCCEPRFDLAMSLLNRTPCGMSYKLPCPLFRPRPLSAASAVIRQRLQAGRPVRVRAQVPPPPASSASAANSAASAQDLRELDTLLQQVRVTASQILP